MSIEKTNDIDILPCWEFFKCGEEFKRVCPAYQNGTNMVDFKDCSLFILDNQKGGPAKRGPCVTCDYTKEFFPDIFKFFNK